MGPLRESSCDLSPCLWPRMGAKRSPGVVSDLCFSPAVNPCCHYPCQHQGICVRFGLDQYQCDCTRTGYSGPNCTVRELSPLLPLLLTGAPLALLGLCLETSPARLVSGCGPGLWPLTLSLTRLRHKLALLAHLTPLFWALPCPHCSARPRSWGWPLSSGLLWAPMSIITPRGPSSPARGVLPQSLLAVLPSSRLPPWLLLVPPAGPD